MNYIERLARSVPSPRPGPRRLVIYLPVPSSAVTLSRLPVVDMIWPPAAGGMLRPVPSLSHRPVVPSVFRQTPDKLRHTRSVAYSVELVVLNKHQISGCGAYLHCYRMRKCGKYLRNGNLMQIMARVRLESFRSIIPHITFRMRVNVRC